MIVTELTRRAHAYRKAVKGYQLDGYVKVSENGDPLWKLYRGSWIYKKITDVKIAPGGVELWIKVEDEPRCSRCGLTCRCSDEARTVVK